MILQRRFRAITLLLTAVILSIAFVHVSAENAVGENQFPDGVIEVPQGTPIAIDDDAGTVTITNNPAAIAQGDTFVVYLQDLPIGYVANSVSVDADKTVISVTKADKSVYELLDSEGVVELTSDTYEFIPAPGVTYSRFATIGDGLSYSDGRLSIKVPLGGSSAQVYLENLKLSHSISDGNISVVLNGKWGIETSESVSEDLLEDIPLGEMRIYGVGKIAVKLSLEQSLSISCNLSGTFSVGVTAMQGGGGQASKSFTVTNQSVEGKGSITAFLKVTAGIDILVAEADLYAEISAKTQYNFKNTTDPDTRKATHCDDFRIYLYSTVGAEAKYYSILAGEMKTLASADVELIGGGNGPIVIVTHFENSQRTSYCTQGMEVPALELGGITANFGSTLLTDNRERILETSVNLPWDMVIDGDYRIANGNLNLNGHTLTINGDLIQSGGTLTIGSGTLIVKGDYRLQSESDGTYGDSSGSLDMRNSAGVINLNGDLILQTTSSSHSVTAGTFNIKGNIRQINPSKGSSSFLSGTRCNFVLTSDHSHTLTFDDAGNNGIGWLTLNNDVTAQSSIRICEMDMNGYSLTVNGDMIAMDEYYLYDIDLDGGVLTITGTLYQHGGIMTINHGKLDIGGSYYLVGANTDFKHGVYKGADACLKMIYADDEVRVGSSFLTMSNYTHTSNLSAGVLYVGGDFTQLNGFNSNFAAEAGHKTVLNGSAEQVVSFESSYSGFGTLEVTNKNIVFMDSVNWLAQNSDIHAVFRNARVSFTRNIDLNGKHLTIDSDIWMNGSNVDIHGGKLTVNGTLYQAAGTLNVNGGRVSIRDNYCIVGADSVLEEGKENYTYCSGRLKMVNEADEVRVGGSFLTTSYSSHTGNLTAGVLYVGGDFTQLNGAKDNFNAAAGLKTVLNGTAEQVVSFKSDSSGFGTLEVTNDRIVIKDNVSWLVQSSDIHAVSRNAHLSKRDIDLNGKQLTIDGDIWLSGSSVSAVNIHGGKLTVNGTLYHDAGTLKVNCGSVSIRGNYCIVGADSVLEKGKENYTDSNGILHMVNEEDELRVSGSFLTKSNVRHVRDLKAGVLYVGGDFTQLNGSEYNFSAPVGHKTVLNGSAKQTVSFESSYSGFGTLEVTNKNIVFMDSVNWLVQNSDIHAVFRNARVSFTRNIDLNGKHLTIDSDIWMNGSNVDIHGGKLTVNGTLYQAAGTLNVNGGCVNIQDNYYIVGSGSSFEIGKENYTQSKGILQMANEADEVRVGGNFLTSSSVANSNGGLLAAGVLYVGGDFTQLGGGSSMNFSAAAGHRTVLNGSTEQVISFESVHGGFGTLEATNDKIVFKDMVNWKVQNSDIHAASRNAKLKSIRNINLNGKKLTIDGDVWMCDSDVDIHGGKLTVNGTLYQAAGTLNVNGGSAVIGNYYIVGEDSVLEEGKENYTRSSGVLNMVNEADEVRVVGSFLTKSNVGHNYCLTAGVLYVGGDFTQLSGGAYENFIAQVGHKTVLNGRGRQTISFAGNSHFGILQLTKPLSNYTFTPNPCWTTLLEADIPALTLPAALTQIEDEAFINNTGIVIVEIPGNALTQIGSGAFKGCADLCEITIPSSVTWIAPDAFEGCPNLTIISASGSYAQQYAEAHGIDWLEE